MKSIAGVALALGSAAAVLAVGGCGRSPSANVIVVTIDTIRPDHLGWENHAPAMTPNLDVFASEGAYFWRCFAPVPITLPSHTSIMTGTTPLRHGVHDNGLYRVAEQNLTLAEILAGSGYSTAAFVSGYPLKQKFGLAQGFSTYDDDLESDDPYSWSEGSMARGATQMAERPADATTNAAIAWLATAREPFFLWIHYFDPHQGYAPPPPYSDSFHANPYDGEIAFVDEQFGRLLARVDDLGLSNGTAVVVTGDHGEGLGDHDELTHAMLAYDSTLRVPLAMHLPGTTRPNQAVRHDVGLIDIQPTLLEFVGIEPPEEIEGESLLGALAGRPIPQRPLYFETEAGTNVFGWARIDGLRLGDWKLIDCTRSELYNLAEDPHEEHEVGGQHPEIVARLTADLEETRLIRERAAATHDTSRLSPSDETREQLAALGYLSGSDNDSGAADATGPAEGELIHPRDHIWVINEWSRLRDDVASERLASAESRLRYLTEYDPSNPDFRNIQGMIYAKTGREAEAEQVWEELLGDGFDRLNILQNLGQLFSRTGRSEKALELYDLALAKATSDDSLKAWLLVRIAEMHKARGDSTAALDALTELAELRPRDPEVLRRQATIHYHAGSIDLAEALLDRSLVVNPYYSRSYQNLAALYLDAGAFDRALENARRCVELAPEYPEGRYILAVALAENGDRQEAVRILHELTDTIATGSLAEQARLLLAELEE